MNSESRPKTTADKEGGGGGSLSVKSTTIKKQFNSSSLRTDPRGRVSIVRGRVHERLQVQQVDQDVHTDQDEAFRREDVQQEGDQIGGGANWN